MVQMSQLTSALFFISPAGVYYWTQHCDVTNIYLLSLNITAVKTTFEIYLKYKSVLILFCVTFLTNASVHRENNNNVICCCWCSSQLLCENISKVLPPDDAAEQVHCGYSAPSNQRKKTRKTLQLSAHWMILFHYYRRDRKGSHRIYCHTQKHPL